MRLRLAPGPECDAASRSCQFERRSSRSGPQTNDLLYGVIRGGKLIQPVWTGIWRPTGQAPEYGRMSTSPPVSISGDASLALWEDGERAFRRERRLNADGNLIDVLM